MRLSDWLKNCPEPLEQIAPKVGVTPSNLSKIANGHFWVSGDTAERIRQVTNGAVTLDDVHDAWRERQRKVASA